MRPLFAVAGWIAAAAAATGIGLAGVQTIGTGITAGTDGNVLTAGEAARELAAAGPAPVPSPSASSSLSSPSAPPSSSPPGQPDQPANVQAFAGPGGTVSAGCLPGGAYLVSWSAAPGYGVEEYRRGPGEYAEVRFESGNHSGKGRGESRVRIRCTANVPSASWS